MERYLLILNLLVLLACYPGIAAAQDGALIAVFPVQALGASRNDVDLELTRELTESLAEAGNQIVGMESMTAFMVMNRIRTPGHLDTVNISRLRRDLGAVFILFGTISERNEHPNARLGMTLTLVRTSDMRAVWSYVDGRSSSEERKPLAIGEPDTVDKLKQVMLADLLRKWPWKTIEEEQLAGALELDSVLLSPLNVRPGAEVSCRVRLEDTWGGGQQPRVFFKVAEQIYPATAQSDGVTYEGSWVAGEENGRIPVVLVLDWPVYQRTETALLGNYLVDGTLPLFEFDLLGTKELADRLIFDKQVRIIPRMIVRKQLERWRLSFYFEDEEEASGSMDGDGNLPKGFVWQGMRGFSHRGDGIYRIQLEVWDKAGNMYLESKEVEMLRSLPEVGLALTHSEKEVVADIEYDGKVPLSYWRLEMWTEEGLILTQVEGKDLPVSVDMELPATSKDHAIEGIIFTRDILGKVSRQEVSKLLPKLSEQQEEKDNEGASEKWVDEF